MAHDARKQQKKQERRVAKRKAKSRELARTRSAGLAERFAAAEKYPIFDCWASADVWTSGIGYIGLSRELPGGQIGFAWFLVDRYCLGVKDVIVEILGRFSYGEKLRKVQSRFLTEPMEPAAARKFVEGSVDYAEKLGLPPHPDYNKAKYIFGSIDAGACTETFEYGMDGKPHFIAGPFDTPERCRRIMTSLEQHCGPGGYHYLMPVGPGTPISPLADHIELLEMDDDEPEEPAPDM